MQQEKQADSAFARTAITVAVADQAPLSVQVAYDAVCHPAHGAIDTFVGVVRNHHDGMAVTGITYDAHPAMARHVFHEICATAQQKWPQTCYYIGHYHGYVPVGGMSVVIAVSAAHRDAVFAACRFCIENLKQRAPIWKQEHYPNGKSAWLPGHSLQAY
jgi:molybdopterin synthase catalytic subunit